MLKLRGNTPNDYSVYVRNWPRVCYERTCSRSLQIHSILTIPYFLCPKKTPQLLMVP